MIGHQEPPEALTIKLSFETSHTRNKTLTTAFTSQRRSAFEGRLRNAFLRRSPDAAFTRPVHCKLLDAGTSLCKSELEACFNLISMTSHKDYQQSSVGWSPRAKKAEMAHEEMEYLILYHPEPDSTVPISAARTGTLRTQQQLEVIGFISFMRTFDDPPHTSRLVAYVYEIHLSAAYRSFGLGGLLLDFVEDLARDTGITKTMLTVFTCNKRAEALYRRRGYETDECSPRGKEVRGRVVGPDYVIMSKVLGEEV